MRWTTLALGACLIAGFLIGARPDPAAGSDRPAATGGRWIVAVARDGGSAIGPRAAVGRLPRLRAGVPGDASARRAVQRILRTGGIRARHIYRHAFDGFSGVLSGPQVAALARDPAVAVLMPDRLVHVEAASTAATARRVALGEFVLPTGIRRVRAQQGALSRIDGQPDPLDVDVAIIDTGIDPSAELRIAGGHDCTTDDPRAWRDREGHGTHVAGIVAARDDDQGVVGVAPGARLWAIKIFDDNGNGYLSQQLCAYDHVLGLRDPDAPSRPRIEVVNLSIGQWLGGADDRDCGRASGDLVHGALCALVADGTTVVAAAGNQSTESALRMPAAYDEVITVSALADYDGRPGGEGRQSQVCPGYSADTDDTFGNFSNHGADVDIIAPGKCILSTLPRGAYGLITGTSMATPHVAGAAALLAAAHPGATPGQIRAALLGAATDDWVTETDPDQWPDPLLDVSRLGDLPDLSIVAGDPSDDLARGGITRVALELRRTGGHRGPVVVRATDLPDGIRADIRPDPTRGDALDAWFHATGAAPAGQLTLTLRATDGDLVRTTTVTLRVRGGGPIVTFSAPVPGPAGAHGVRITEGDGAQVAFLETAPGARPVERRVQAQRGAVATPGTCEGVDWSAVGDPVTPGELDPDGSVEAGWSFDAELEADGCTRWLVRLVDGDGGSARFASPAILRDTADPATPVLRASGAGAWQRTGNAQVWVRAGSGTLDVVATGRDADSGAVDHVFGALSDPTGWQREPGLAGGASSALRLTWGPGALDTELHVTATDAVGRQGTARRVRLRVDAEPPRVLGWREPRSDTFAVTGDVPELDWRQLRDDGSGVAFLQPIQRQVARPVRGACRRATWVDDGPVQWVARHDEQWTVRTDRCYRWVLRPVDRVGNVGPQVVSGTVLLDLAAPVANFRTPNEGRTVLIRGRRFKVSWVERAGFGGGPIGRLLERERVEARGRTCPANGWVAQGRPRAGKGPVKVTGLRRGYCYRWRLNLADREDNIRAELSGVVRVKRR